MSLEKREYLFYIDDMVRSAEFILEFTENFSFADFDNDIKTQFAVIRCFEVLGEAVKRIPVNIKEFDKTIPWKVIAGMRDRLIHGYDKIDSELLWRTVTQDIKPLLIKLQSLKNSL